MLLWVKNNSSLIEVNGNFRLHRAMMIQMWNSCIDFTVCRYVGDCLFLHSSLLINGYKNECYRTPHI